MGASLRPAAGYNSVLLARHGGTLAARKCKRITGEKGKTIALKYLASIDKRFLRPIYGAAATRSASLGHSLQHRRGLCPLRPPRI